MFITEGNLEDFDPSLDNLDADPTWIVILNTRNITENYSSKFGTHGNKTIFHRYPPLLMDFAAATFIAFAIVGVLGNLISVLALSRSTKLRNATTAFIVNLCIADLLFCCFSMPISAITFLERDWNYGDVLCKMFPLVRYSNGGVSILSVIAITINRYILIVHPSWYFDMYKPRNIAIMIALIWISSLVILLFPLFELWGRFGYDHRVGTCTILTLNGQSPKITLYLIAFGLPSLVFVVCYSRIFWVVRKASKKARSRSFTTIQSSVTYTHNKSISWKSRQHSESKDGQIPLKRSRQELKVLKVMMVLFVTFAICYFPVSFVKIFRKEDDMPILNILGYMGVYFSNIINPVIYIIMSNEYRQAYVELFCSTSPKADPT